MHICENQDGVGSQTASRLRAGSVTFVLTISTSYIFVHTHTQRQNVPRGTL